MRFAALLGCVALVTGCAKTEAPATDTAAAEPPHMSLTRLGYIWDMNVRPEGKDSVVTTYILNATDTTEWNFAFTNGKPTRMTVTKVVGDTVYTDTDWFDSSVRPGLKAKSSSVVWLMDGKLVGKNTVKYQTTGPDTLRVYDVEGTRR